MHYLERLLLLFFLLKAYLSSRHLYRDYFLHYSITSKAPFHLPKKYSIRKERLLGKGLSRLTKSGK